MRSSVPRHRWAWRRRAASSAAALPWGVLKAAGLVWPMWREIAEMSYLWQVPHALDGTALERAVGPLQTTSLDSALREALLDLGFVKAPARPVMGSS